MSITNEKWDEELAARMTHDLEVNCVLGQGEAQRIAMNTLAKLLKEHVVPRSALVEARDALKDFVSDPGVYFDSTLTKCSKALTNLNTILNQKD